MSLLNEVIPEFMDPISGLVSPSRRTPSFNGVMYTGEFAVLLHLNGELNLQTAKSLQKMINPCFKEPGLIMRTPSGDGGITSPDDLMGLAALCKALRIAYMGYPPYAGDVLKYGLFHLGSYNNVKPGKWTFKTFFWRQPQLIGAFLAARGGVPPWGWPFLWFAALSIFLSCRNTPASDTDARRLSWLLVQITGSESWVCRLAAKGWYKRLYAAYGRGGMKAVAHVYYGLDHPFTKYWVD